MRRPPLNAEDAALWAAVAGTIKPLPGRKPMLVRQLVGTRKSLPMPAAPVAKPRIAPPAPRGIGATLDGSWDKKLAQGQAVPDRTIDLHGHTLERAHAALDHALGTALASGARLLLVVTGKPVRDNPRLPPERRGVIRASIMDWLDHSRHSGAIAAVRGAHRRHGGSGALYIVLRRQR